MAGKKEAKQKSGPCGQTEKNRGETGSSTGTRNTSKECGQSTAQKNTEYCGSNPISLQFLPCMFFVSIIFLQGIPRKRCIQIIYRTVSSTVILKVVGNEKEGGSGKWQMIDIGLGLW